MKKAILAVAAALVASTASAAIQGSSHDFTSFGTAGGGARCAYCHMPHNGASAGGAPLWARNITYSQVVTPYTSVVTGAQASPGTNETSYGAGTRVCLSCHDGTQVVAVVLQASGSGSQNISTSGTSNTTLAGSPALISTDLSNDHPVSVTYNGAANNPAGLAAAANAAFSLPGGKIECISCHNAHAAKGTASSYPNRQFMVTIATDFCGGCHSLK